MCSPSQVWPGVTLQVGVALAPPGPGLTPPLLRKWAWLLPPDTRWSSRPLCMARTWSMATRSWWPSPWTPVCSLLGWIMVSMRTGTLSLCPWARCPWCPSQLTAPCSGTMLSIGQGLRGSGPHTRVQPGLELCSAATEAARTVASGTRRESHRK